jgi:ribokinase
MARIAVVGSINSDQVIRCAQLPRPGETVFGYEASAGFGGKGGNQAVTAASLGAPTTMIAAVGADDSGAAALLDLARYGVDVTHVVRVADTRTGEALVLVADSGENAIIVLPGANARLTGADVSKRLAALQLGPGDVVLAGAEVSDGCVEAAALACAAGGARLMYNMAPARPLASSVAEHRPLLVLNEREAMSVADEPTLHGALDRLAVSAEAVIVTLGARGALLRRGDVVIPIRTVAVNAVDSTGAGDAFCGALAAELVNGQSLPVAAGSAALAGSLSVTGRGARGAVPTRAAIARARATGMRC